MKKILNLLLLLFVLLLPINVLANDTVSLKINEKDVPFSSEMGFPFISNENRTMVPVSIIAQSMDYVVAWNNDTKVVGLSNDINSISLQIGSSRAKVNGVEVLVDKQDGLPSSTTAQIYNGRTYVPLRFITESMGGVIEYAKENNVHKINIINDGRTKVVPIPAPAPSEILKTYSFPEIKGANIFFNGKTLTVENYGINNKVGIQKADGKRRHYDLFRDIEEIVLLEGSGSYTISLYQQKEGTTYFVKGKVTKFIELSNNYDPYIFSAQPVYWGDLEFNLSNEIVKDARSDADKIRLIHSYVTKNIKYDYDFAEQMTIKAFPYYPENEKTLRTKKGICYDYASLFGGLARSQGIPTKLVKGYMTGNPEYHAWNEVFVDGQWKSVDTTSDSVIENKNIYTPSVLLITTAID